MLWSLEIKWPGLEGLFCSKSGISKSRYEQNEQNSDL